MRKCPLHKFGATYKATEDGLICDTCGALHKPVPKIMKDLKGTVRVENKKNPIYETDNFLIQSIKW